MLPRGKYTLKEQGGKIGKSWPSRYWFALQAFIPAGKKSGASREEREGGSRLCFAPPSNLIISWETCFSFPLFAAG